jgi:hypothetical protein
MNKDRRNWMASLSAIGLTSLLPTDGEAGEQREAKSLTTAALVRSVLTLADKAAKSEMPHASELLMEVAAKILKGEPVVPCTTDSDCERKNPRLAGQGGRK